MVVAAVPAPAETPMVPGSARGLRMTDCSSAPEADRDAPIMIANSSRGRRRFITMTLTVLFSAEKRARRISVTEYPALPTAMATADNTTSRISRISHTVPTRRALTCRLVVVVFIVFPFTPQRGPAPGQPAR